QTATGKLNAVTMPTGPSGCHCSINRWLGRSDAMVSPCSWRERPTANSQMSIISCTSPRPSGRIFPVSSETSSPRGSLNYRSSSPRRRTTCPRIDNRRAVLVTDGHPELRVSLQRLLERAGYHVLQAGNGAEGLEHLRRARIDVVVLDMDMPVMNGRAFLAARAADPELSRVPV